MTKGAAKEELLGRLHQKVAEAFIRAIDTAEVTDEEGNSISLITPAMLQAASVFLKNNDITVQRDSTDMTELAQRLHRKRQAKVAGGVHEVIPLFPEDED